MQTKTLTLLVLSASAVLASPFHKRQTYDHQRFHGTGVLGTSVQATGTGHHRVNNSTEAPSGTSSDSIPVLTKTVSPLPQTSDAKASTVSTFAHAAAAVDTISTSCTTTSIATETSVEYITVTARTIASANQVDSNQHWGGNNNNNGGGNGWSRSAEATTVAAASSPAAATVAKQSTTFATMASVAWSSAVTQSVSVASSAAAGSKTSSASAAATSTSSTGSTSGKRGISYNSASLVSAFGSSVSWAYNWGSTSGGLTSGVEYVPMCWGSDQVSTCASQFGSATHVLSFNEPDLAAQANMDPVTAATLHKQVFSSLKGKVQIGSPAVTNGATTSPPMGVNWLDQFLTACGTDCPVDFVAYHWYNTASSIADFKQHTQDIINVAAKHSISKVWLTEFAPSGSASDQASFMAQAVDFLESTAAVERYAAFMASSGTLLSGSSLNSVGSAYTSA